LGGVPKHPKGRENDLKKPPDRHVGIFKKSNKKKHGGRKGGKREKKTRKWEKWPCLKTGSTHGERKGNPEKRKGNRDGGGKREGCKQLKEKRERRGRSG